MHIANSTRTRSLCLLLGLVAVTVVNVHAAEAQKRDLPDGKGFYMVSLPKDHDPKKSYDLIICLHGAGDTAENYARCFANDAGERDSIIATPEASAKAGPGWTWNTEDEKKIQPLIDDCVKMYGADRKRIMLTGHSAGCAIGFYVVSKHPDTFACFGGTAQGVEPFVNKKELEKAAATTALYYAVGKQDPNHKFYPDNVAILNKMKFNMVTEEPDIPHTITGEEVKKMLEVFDGTADKVNAERLTDAKKQLADKNWGGAETVLSSVASGKGPSSVEAKTLLENLKKDFAAKFDEAKALKGPAEVDALKKLEHDYRGTSLASDAKTLEEQVSNDPATKQMAEKQRKDDLEAKAQQAMTDAQALEKANKLQLALDAYQRVVKDFAESSLKPKAQESADRLAKDPRLTAQKNAGEADKMLKRADNFLRNGANDEAKEILTEVIQKFPDTDAARQAKAKSAELK